MSNPNMSLDDKCFNVAAASFLCELPEVAWSNFTDEEVNQFISDNLWEPFQYWDAEDVRVKIMDLKDDILSLTKDHILSLNSSNVPETK